MREARALEEAAAIARVFCVSKYEGGVLLFSIRRDWVLHVNKTKDVFHIVIRSNGIAFAVAKWLCLSEESKGQLWKTEKDSMLIIRREYSKTTEIVDVLDQFLTFIEENSVLCKFAYVAVIAPLLQRRVHIRAYVDDWSLYANNSETDPELVDERLWKQP